MKKVREMNGIEKIAYRNVRGIFSWEVGGWYNCIQDGCEEYIQKLKREIREYTHRVPGRKCIWQGGDSYTERKDVPAEVESLEEAEEWFECMERIEYIPREYDCTGQAFTSWHHIGILGGKMVCWHHVCYDV